MATRKRYSPEQIISKLREAEVLLIKGQTTGMACRKIGITEQTYYRWRKEYGGLRTDQAAQLTGQSDARRVCGASQYFGFRYAPSSKMARQHLGLLLGFSCIQAGTEMGASSSGYQLV